MLAIGYKYGMWKQEIYFDSHEPEEVVVYRKIFCQRWCSLFDRMTAFEGDNMDVVCPPPDNTQPEIVWVTHDESVFYANDDVANSGHTSYIATFPRNPVVVQ